MKLILRQMGRTTFSESTRQSAKHDLDRLIKAIFHHAVSAEQACVMADMAKGADPEVVSEVRRRVLIFVAFEVVNFVRSVYA